MCKRLLFSILAVLILFSSVIADAQSAPDNIERTVSGAMQSYLQSLGYSSTDPLYYNTLKSMSTAAQTDANTLPTSLQYRNSGASAPTWAGILADSGSSFLNGSTPLGNGTSSSFTFSPSGVTSNLSSTQAGMISGGAYCVFNSQNGADLSVYYDSSYWASSSTFCNAGSCTSSIYSPVPSSCSVTSSVGTLSVNTCSYQKQSIVYDINHNVTSNTTANAGTQQVTCYSSGAVASCPAGQAYSTSTKTCTNLPLANQAGSLGSAINTIPSGDLNASLNPQISTALTNALWQQASNTSGYAGVPYSPFNPVTQDYVNGFTSANPAYTPTVSNLVSPRLTSGATGNPDSYSLAVNPTSASTSTLTASSSNANTSGTSASQLGLWQSILGVLNSIWTAITGIFNYITGGIQSFFNTILSYFPNFSPADPTQIPDDNDVASTYTPDQSKYQNFIMKLNIGTPSCTPYQIALLNQTFTSTALCDFFSTNQSFISTMFLLIFSVTAVFIVLSA